MIIEDRRVSPYTGWTRKHWENAADDLLLALRPHFSPGHGLLDLPGTPSAAGTWSDGLEGFARSFLLAGFRLSCAETDPHGIAQWYAEGLAAGTDPDSPDRWPDQDEINQARVEAACVAIALHETRHRIWAHLDDRVRERVVAWLARAVGMPMAQNNWMWFQAVVNAFLRSVGGPWSAEDLAYVFDHSARWFGAGWFSDGPIETRRAYDYYSGWVMQFYPLWYCRMSGADTEPGFLDICRRRATGYVADLAHLFGADGAPMYHGRSLTYRYAMLGPLWAAELQKCSPLPAGTTRRIASGTLRYFLENGARNAEGLLPIGWHGECPDVRQSYSGPGSPYWSSNGFAGLALPPDHPVWTQVEEPMPVEEGDFVRTMHAPGWVAAGTCADGIVRMVSHGTDHATPGEPTHDDPVYARHAYSTHAGPQQDAAGILAPLDSHVALLDAGGRPSHRRPLERIGVHGRSGVSRHRAHWVLEATLEPGRAPQARFALGPWVTTASVLNGAWEVRAARVDPEGGERIDGALQVGGYALAGQGVSAWARDEVAEVRRGDLVSTVVGGHGLPIGGCAEACGGNAFGRGSTTPWVRTAGSVEPGRVYVALIALAAAPAARPVVELDGSTVRIAWADGSTDAVRLDGPDPTAVPGAH